MNKILEPNVSEECTSKNVSQQQTKNDCSEDLPKNPLLYLFVQYAWDPRHGPCYTGHEYKKLESLLETAESSWNNSMNYRDPEGRLCHLRKPSAATYNEDFQRRTQDEKNIEILAHVVYKLKSFIGFLNESKGDVKKGCQRNWTLLHPFLYECRDVPVDASEDQISRIRKILESLVEMEAPLYEVNYKGQTMFHLAILCENQQILQTMISCLTDLRKYDPFGNTVLHIIVDNCVDEEGNHKDGYVDLVRTLVSKGANVNAKNNDGMTPVHLAAGKFQIEMLKLFADEGANFDERTNDDKTPLQFVCKSTLKLNDQSKIIEAFDFLVSQECDFGLVDEEGHTLLHLAAEFCHGVQVVERLIALGVRVDCRTAKTLLTPLYLAAKSDKLDNMKALLRAGADVNAEAADGSTPVFMSAMLGSYESMQFLIDHGADLHRRDNLLGFTPLHMATNGVYLRRAELSADERLKKLEVLIEKGLDVNDAGICGVTPLQLAALATHVDAVILLLDRGAEVDRQVSQWTALHVALLMHDVEIVKTLLAKGADVHRRGGTGHWSPIHLSVLNRNFVMGWYPEAVEKDDVRLSCPVKELWGYERRSRAPEYLDLATLLIDHGADVNVQNAFGETPLHLLKPYTISELDAIRKLLDAGAHINVQDRKGSMPMRDAWNIHGTTGLELLLDSGVDINDDDSSELIMNAAVNAKNTAIQHVIKRMLVGLPVATVYEPLVSAPEFVDFHERCSKEAADFIDHRDADGFSLYEFLRMNPKFQFHYIDKISRCYKNLEELFPMYASLIRGACRESAIRRQLLESARIVWAENTNVRLPSVCVEHILSYLSNRYLKVLTTTLEEIIIIEDERIAFVITYG